MTESDNATPAVAKTETATEAPVDEARAAVSDPAPAVPLPRRSLAFWRAGWFVPALGIVSLLSMIAIAALWWQANSDLSFTQREFARRIADADARATSAVQTAHEAANALLDANRQLAVLDSRLSESRTEQAALEQMYQELSRNRDEIQLADIEQSIAAAAQQLQVSGNVQAAIIVLQNADARLARINKPQFVGVRRAIARDLDRLKALPSTDVSGMAVKLDQMISLIDAMPTLIDERPVALAPAASKATKPGVAPIQAPWWSALTDRLGQELRNLVRIREVGAPDALLLSPAQAYFLRENLKLRLLNARLQLLARNEAGFRTDLQAALDAIGRYFDGRARQTVNAVAVGKQLQAAQVSVDLPSLSDSLGAVRNFKPGPGVPPQSAPTLPPAARGAAAEPKAR